MDGQARRLAFLDGVVKTVRKVLAERWPTVTFEVRPVERAFWQRLDIHWDDGPTRFMVQHLVEATVAAIDDRGDAPDLETHTRRTLTEEGVAAALAIVTEQPPAGWLNADGTVSWLRFSIPEASALMAEYTLPQPAVSAHHLAAMLAERIDLSVAVAQRRVTGMRPPR